MAEGLNAVQVFNDIDDTIEDNFDDDLGVKAVAFVNGKYLPVLGVEADTEEGWVILNIGTQEVKREG